MNIVFLSSLLAPSQVWGGIAFLLLFVVCFVLVHALKLSSLGYRVLHENPPEKSVPAPPPEKPKKATKKTPAKRKKRAKTTAPVYYLVEKKRVKKTPEPEYYDYEYAPPQRIRFTKETDRKDDYV